MQIVFDQHQQYHNPQFFLVRGLTRPSPERPERAERLLSAARQAGHHVIEPEDYGDQPRAAIHSPEYLLFLANAYERWQALGDNSPEIIANIHPNRYPSSYPRSLVGQAGFHMADTACPIGAHTWSAACAAANSAVHAARLLLDGAPVAYALCRPPGHHAFADMAGGFCFLNNAAIAAQYLRQSHDRVAILDVDVHHGNGTQAIFYQRADVLHVSLHTDPADYYPFFWGYAHERGTGPGEGYTLNYPLPLGCDDAHYLQTLEQSLEAIRRFSPGALVVALGLDTHHQDPLQGMALSTACFQQIANRIAGLGLATLLIQEGGYPSEALGGNLVSFLSGFAAVS